MPPPSQNTTLTSASLVGNLLTDAAAVALAAALAGNKTLTKLDLARNSIRAIGAQALRQALHTNTALVSFGALDALPIAVGLRSSIEWYLRHNQEKLEAVALEALRATQQRTGMLKLLPPEERKLRKQIFALEDENSIKAREHEVMKVEGEQVDKLLRETIKRNAELVDAVATLQGQVDVLRRDAAKRRVAKSRAKLRAAEKSGARAYAPSAAPPALSSRGAPLPPKGPKAPTAGKGGAKGGAASDAERHARAVMTARERAKAGLAPLAGHRVGMPESPRNEAFYKRDVVGSHPKRLADEADAINRLWNAAADEEAVYGEEDEGGLSDVEVADMEGLSPSGSDEMDADEHRGGEGEEDDGGALAAAWNAAAMGGARGGWTAGMLG